jgi:hypothetical protein
VERALIDGSENPLAFPARPHAPSLGKPLSFAELIRNKMIENALLGRIRSLPQPQEQDMRPLIASGEKDLPFSRVRNAKEDKLLAPFGKPPVQPTTTDERPCVELEVTAVGEGSRAQHQLLTQQQQRLLDLFCQPPARCGRQDDDLAFGARGRTQEEDGLLGLIGGF